MYWGASRSVGSGSADVKWPGQGGLHREADVDKGQESVWRTVCQALGNAGEGLWAGAGLGDGGGAARKDQLEGLEQGPAGRRGNQSWRLLCSRLAFPRLALRTIAVEGLSIESPFGPI